MNKKILMPLIAILVIALVSSVSAGELISGGVTTTLNEVILDNTTSISGITGEVVPIRVVFKAGVDEEDVRVKVELEGYRDDVSASTDRFDIVQGRTYSKLLSLELPSDMDTTSEEYTLHVSITSKDRSDRAEYDLTLQRESYDLNILSVDYGAQASAGSTIPVSVVIENVGMQKLHDGYIVVSINDLGVSSRGYFGDLLPIDDCEGDCDIPDSLQKTVYLSIPANAKSGVYDLSVKVYNKDVVKTATGFIKIEDTATTTVISGANVKDIEAGQTGTYDLIIVNSGKTVGIYNIKTTAVPGIRVSAPSVVTVGPDSSTNVPVTVTVSDNAEIGAYAFSVGVNNQPVDLIANVTSEKVSSPVMALTIILVVIFVVLLVILIVLLTRKERPVEEAETSYY